MNITMLPSNKIEVAAECIDDEKALKIKMLGELSLELLNFDFEPICQKAFTLAQHLATLQPSKRLTSPAVEFANEVRSVLGSYHVLNAEVATTPLSAFISPISIKPHLRDLLLESADNGKTVEEAIRYHSNDERIAFTDDEYFDSTYHNFYAPWKRAYESLMLFRSLFNILIYSKEKSLVEKAQDFGIDNLNEQIKKMGGADTIYSVISHEGKMLFTETYRVGLPELLVLEFVKMLQANISIKRCLNCGKLFALYSGHKNNYCSFVPTGETQSCFIVGPINQFKKKTQENPLLKMFDKVKKRIHARGTRNGTGYIFEDWSQLASQIRDEALVKNLSPAEMEKRLEAASEKIGI